MSQVYFKRKPFWTEEKQKSNSKKSLFIFSIVIIVGVLILNIFYYARYDSNLKSLKTKKIGKFEKMGRMKIDTLIYKIKRRFLKFYIYLQNQNYSKNYQSIQYQLNKNKFKEKSVIQTFKINPILQSTLNDYIINSYKFKRKILYLYFLGCKNEIESQELEAFFNFHLNLKTKQFEIIPDYADDFNIFNNNLCFSSGRAHIALRTEDIPKCIELKNLYIENFYYQNKNNSNIIMKFHLFRVVNTKIHIFPINKQILTARHFKKYFNRGEDKYHFFVEKNIIIYRKGLDKLIRICNILSEENSKIFENKLWFELNWDPIIQNILCFEDLAYVK
jgi:hypothetical protein